MTKINNNPILQGASGKMGNTHYYRVIRGTVQMCNLPGERKRTTSKQKKQNNRFKRAIEYAKGQTRIPEMKALYAKAIDDKRPSAYNVALTDFLTPPVIHLIQPRYYTGDIGSLITIKATDDFRVEKVTVTILDAGGKTIEEGEAARNKRKPFMWNYRATIKNRRLKGCIVRAVAEDMPGNETMSEITLDGQASKLFG